jgi:hypothetical protein
MMNKRRIGPLLALLLCVSMTAVFFSGCGSGGAARLENPLDFFNQTRANMQTVASFRMSGEMLMDITGVPGMETMAIDYDMAWEQKSDGEIMAKMDMHMEGPPTFDAEAYLTGDRMYLEMPGGLWVYEDINLSSDLTDMSQTMGPQYVMEMLDMAESAEVVAEDEDHITYDLVLDFDKMMQEQELGMEELIEELAEKGVSEEDIPSYMDFMRDLFSQMQMQMTVDKGSGLATNFSLYLEMDYSLLAALSSQATLPEGANMAMDADFKISDYGKAFNIQLPGEAEDAIPMEDLEKMAET